MKHFIFFAVSIVVLAIAFYVYVRVTTKPVIYSGLSKRAKEYLKTRKKTGDTDWKNTHAEESGISQMPGIKVINIPSCFSITVPFMVTEVRKESDCQYRVFITNPAGYVVAYKRSQTISSLDDSSDISMRRMYADKYLEKKMNVDGRTFLVFKATGDEYEASAFYLENKELFVFNLLVPTNENLDKKFDEMLRSIKIYNE